MSDTQFEIPDSFDYNERDLERPREQLADSGPDTIYRGTITKMTRAIGGNKNNPEKASKNLQLLVSYRVLDDNDKPVGPVVFDRCDIPVSNPNVPGHRPYISGKQMDFQFKRARDLVRAVLGDDALPTAPRKRDDGSYFDPDTSEALSPAEVRERFNAINKATIRYLQKWWAEAKDDGTPEPVGAQVFFAMKTNDKGYSNVHFVRHDDGGKTVVTTPTTA